MVKRTGQYQEMLRSGKRCLSFWLTKEEEKELSLYIEGLESSIKKSTGIGAKIARSAVLRSVVLEKIREGALS